MENQCCDKCTDTDKCGRPLPELSAAAGHEMLDNCDCECDENQSRLQERNAIHANVDIDTSEADAAAKAGEA